MCVYVTPKDNALQQNILVKKEDFFRLFFIIKKNVKRFAVYESLVCVFETTLLLQISFCFAFGNCLVMVLV